MIYYGDRTERVEPAARLRDVASALARLGPQPPGLDRHQQLVRAFIDLAGVAQGVADAVWADGEVDRRTPAVDALMAGLARLAQSVAASWRSGFATLAEVPRIDGIAGLPDTIEVRVPEGYAFYALYPEAYADAAARLRLSGTPRVIGIRSIGTGLAALVAASLGAPPPLTVRPTGHPFQRQVRLASELARELAADRDAAFVVVDEGPGLSGSSLGAVADALEALGVAPERIAFVSGHGSELGPRASERHRRRWATAQRVAADIDGLLAARLGGWLEAALGPLERPLEDLSGGAWRRALPERDWPAVFATTERRKFLAQVGGAHWLVKFAGLGAEGERKLARARVLHAAGDGAEPVMLVHGFLVERWEADALPVRHLDDALVDAAGRYLGRRARLLPADDRDGAALSRLFEMARFNAGELLGAGAVRLDGWRDRLAALSSRVVRVQTDNRCQPHEWRRRPDGSLLKCDAIDHCASHDLVGCQDMAWDVAALEAEFDLDAAAGARLRRAVEAAAGRPLDAELLAFYRPCYLAFRAGEHSLAAQTLAGWPAEQRRNEVAAARYAAALADTLHTPRTHHSQEVAQCA